MSKQSDPEENQWKTLARAAIQRVPLFEHDLHSHEDIQAFAGKLCAQ